LPALLTLSVYVPCWPTVNAPRWLLARTRAAAGGGRLSMAKLLTSPGLTLKSLQTTVWSPPGWYTMNCGGPRVEVQFGKSASHSAYVAPGLSQVANVITPPLAAFA